MASAQQPSHPRLSLKTPDGQERVFELAAADVAIGRASTNDVVLYDPKISRTHTHIAYEKGTYKAVDLGSANGTKVNGKKVTSAELASGDEILIGDTKLRFEREASEDPPLITRIDTVSDLDQSTLLAPLSMTLIDSHLPRLVVHTRAKTWEVPITDDLVIGRSSKSGVCLSEQKVSRQHASVERRGKRTFVKDLGSTNGTYLGSQRIEEHSLNHGDTFRIGSATLVFKSGFGAADMTILSDDRLPALTDQPPVIFVPGFMGSQLWRGGERIWPALRRLFKDPEVARFEPEQPVEVRGLLREVVVIPNLIKLEQYSRLLDYLREELAYESERNLMEFAYDWRQDIRDSAKKLAAAVEAWSVSPPITIIAHSMGSLVSRYYVEHLGGRSKIGRLICIGGPHLGTPRSIVNLTQKSNYLPFGLLGERLRDIFVTFPSAYQLLPNYACAVDQHGNPVDLLAHDEWLPDQFRPYLRNAREFWTEFSPSVSVPAISIFGYGQKTITGVKVQSSDGNRMEVRQVEHNSNGDDTVPEWSAVLTGSEIHPVQQNHGTIYVDKDVKMRLKMELT